MNIRAINRQTGEEWKAREGYIEFLMRCNDEYIIFIVNGRSTSQQILDLNIWEIKTKESPNRSILKPTKIKQKPSSKTWLQWVTEDFNQDMHHE